MKQISYVDSLRKSKRILSLFTPNKSYRMKHVLFNYYSNNFPYLPSSDIPLKFSSSIKSQNDKDDENIYSSIINISDYYKKYHQSRFSRNTYASFSKVITRFICNSFSHFMKNIYYIQSDIVECFLIWYHMRSNYQLLEFQYSQKYLEESQFPSVNIRLSPSIAIPYSSMLGLKCINETDMRLINNYPINLFYLYLVQNLNRYIKGPLAKTMLKVILNKLKNICEQCKINKNKNKMITLWIEALKDYKIIYYLLNNQQAGDLKSKIVFTLK